MLANIDELKAPLRLRQTLDWHLYSQPSVTKFSMNPHLLYLFHRLYGWQARSKTACECLSSLALLQTLLLEEVSYDFFRERFAHGKQRQPELIFVRLSERRQQKPNGEDEAEGRLVYSKGHPRHG